MRKHRKRFGEALHEDHRPGVELFTEGGGGSEPPADTREDGPDEAAHQGGERILSSREETDELSGWREHILPNRDLREHARKQMRG